MNILITHLHLTYVHGSEIWTHTIIRELKKQGHNIYVWTPKYGNEFKTFLGNNLFTLIDHENIKNLKFDFAILQHSTPLFGNIFWREYLIPKLPKKENILVICHSQFGKDEYPLIIDYLKGVKYLTISNEIKNNLKVIPWYGIIKQPIYNEWFDIIPNNSKLNKIIYANHRHPLPIELLNICKLNNIELIQLGNQNKSPFSIIDIIKDSNLIIGTGRWIYEGICSGIPSIISTNTTSLDYITLNNILDYEYYNMTVRNPKSKLVNWENILSNYNPTFNMKEYGKNNYHVELIVNQLLSLYEG